MLGPVSNAEAKNLEAISKAIDQHNSNCPFPASEVRMNPFEVERLGWDQIRGLPIVPDENLGTGSFRNLRGPLISAQGISAAALFMSGRLFEQRFPSPASGSFYLEARQDIVREVEQLLAEK